MGRHRHTYDHNRNHCNHTHKISKKIRKFQFFLYFTVAFKTVKIPQVAPAIPDDERTQEGCGQGSGVPPGKGSLYFFVTKGLLKWSGRTVLVLYVRTWVCAHMSMGGEGSCLFPGT